MDELRPFTSDEIEALAIELGPVYGPLVVFAAETGLRTNERVALERRDVDRGAAAVTVQRHFADGRLTPYPKRERSRRRVPLTARALSAVWSLAPRLDTPLLFPAPRGGYIGLDAWRTREWYPAFEAAGIAKRGPYALRHTFATEALAADVSIVELARLTGDVGQDDRPHVATWHVTPRMPFARSSTPVPRVLAGKWRRTRPTTAGCRNATPLGERTGEMERTGIEPATSGLQFS
jgi:integrase